MAPFPPRSTTASSTAASAAPAGRVITTPAGSTIEAIDGGGYRVCDAGSHCRQAPNLWEAQQLVQWSEVHHQPLDQSGI